jgi:Ca2+-binding EF-hand superfamily protein
MNSKTIMASLATTAALLALTQSALANPDPQREQVQANFKTADVNQNEQLDMAEFKTFINLNADHNLGQASKVRRFGMYETAFGTADTNKDGAVSKEEIAAQAKK